MQKYRLKNQLQFGKDINSSAKDLTFRKTEKLPTELRLQNLLPISLHTPDLQSLNFQNYQRSIVK